MLPVLGHRFNAMMQRNFVGLAQGVCQGRPRNVGVRICQGQGARRDGRRVQPKRSLTLSKKLLLSGKLSPLVETAANFSNSCCCSSLSFLGTSTRTRTS